MDTDTAAPLAYSRLIRLEVVPPHNLYVHFEDNVRGLISLDHLKRARAGGVFEPLKDPEYFALGRFDPQANTVVWPNGADIALEELYRLAREGAKG